MQRPHEQVFEQGMEDIQGEEIGDIEESCKEALVSEGYEVVWDDPSNISVGVKGTKVALVADIDGPWAIIVKGSVSMPVTGEILIETEN